MTAADELRARMDAARQLPLHEITTQAALDGMFRDLADVFRGGDDELRHLALERLEKSLWTDHSLALRGFGSRDVEPRLAPFFAVVEAFGGADTEQRAAWTRRLADTLASSWRRDDVRQCAAQWLDRSRGHVPEDERLAAELRVSDRCDPAQAPKLLALLDHPNDWLRSCAAMTLGEAYVDGDTASLPPAPAVLAEFADREVARPGVAGPFFSAIQFDVAKVAGSGFDPGQWMLRILRARVGNEPDLPTNGIDFHAHEWFSDDPDAVGELVRLGHMDIAIEAATEAPSPSMRPVLEGLGASDDPEIVRRASWQLAYHHRVLHPRGAELGFVERFEDALAEWYVLYGQAGCAYPYAVALYPRGAATFSEAAVAICVERVFPATLRGEPRQFGISRLRSDWYERGYIDRFANAAKEVYLVHIGYRGPADLFKPGEVLGAARGGKGDAAR